jgi:hypothetical protein
MGVGDDFRHILPTTTLTFTFLSITLQTKTHIKMSTSLDALKAYAPHKTSDMEQ